MQNMLNKKAFLIGKTVVNLLIAVIVSIFLFMLIVGLGKIFIPDEESDDALQELNNLNAYFESLPFTEISGQLLEHGPVSYLTLKTPEWFLYSDEFGELCGSNFCL